MMSVQVEGERGSLGHTWSGSSLSRNVDGQEGFSSD